jgi:hypothetical protein
MLSAFGYLSGEKAIFNFNVDFVCQHHIIYNFFTKFTTKSMKLLILPSHKLLLYLGKASFALLPQSLVAE